MSSYAINSLYTELQVLLKPLLSVPAMHQQWGIGGSVLLLHLGLLTQARDVDLVCTPESFPALATLLQASYQPLPVTPHPHYRSCYFARFQSQQGQVIELMSGIEVWQTDAVQAWYFEPALLSWQHGLPWMSAGQWLDLYRLFDRPGRINLLLDYLLVTAELS